MNRTGTSHSTYQATLEVGRAVKTILVARYPQDLQREIHDRRNVAEGGTAVTKRLELRGDAASAAPATTGRGGA